jgi:hypothetical protein
MKEETAHSVRAGEVGTPAILGISSTSIGKAGTW